MHEPGSGDFPVTFHRYHGYTQGAGDVFLKKAAEETEFDDAGGAGIGSGEVVEGLVKVEQVLIIGDGIPALNGRKAELLLMAAALFAVTAARMVDQYAAHGLGREGEKMGSILVGDGIAGGDSHPALVQQRMRIQGVPSAFIAEESGRDLLQFRIEGVDDAVAGGGVASCPSAEQLRNSRML